ncbi:MAG: ABC transporter permease subunit [Microbacterium sp.]|uniref:ABC transporter permease n=1 Tax=Microbacterium sp. TaxID=51671 RepID=UPI0026399A40|nr:ABC transporter permease subunit [Microbacterium sp.]MCX6502492.1 ABC transporter permease subunit [Microbacterium sp.]
MTAAGRRHSAVAWKAGFVLVLLAAWQLAAAGGRLGAVPTPVAVSVSLVQIFADGTVWSPLAITLGSWAVSFMLATVIGVLVGFALGMSRLAYRMSAPLLDFLRTIPALALVPLIVLMFGTGMESTVWLATFAAVWAVMLQTIYGVRDIDPVARDTFRSFRVQRIDSLARLTLPTAAPYIATGLRLAAAICLLLTLSVQIVIAAPGIGQQIVVTQLGGAIPQMYAYIVLSGLLGIGINALFVAAERSALRWHVSFRRVEQ